VPEVSLTPPSQMLVRQEALRPRCLAEEELDKCCWTEVNMCQSEIFQSPGSWWVSALRWCLPLRIGATGDYVEDAENVPNVWIGLLEAKSGNSSSLLLLPSACLT
jgi:hypothetical protein